VPLTVPVIFEAPDFVVIDKPAGLLSVPGKGPEKQDCVIARVRAMYPNATGPMMVHRLDMETSGLLIVALTPDAQRRFSRLFEQRHIDKRYTAVLEGHLRENAGEINLPIRIDIDRRPHQTIDPIHGKPSTTRFRVLDRTTLRDHPVTRVEFEPLTGRSHQLRVHSAWGLGAPIVGDHLYGSRALSQRLLLHAGFLAFAGIENEPKQSLLSFADF
jgi:tRNA pseudouridine32 synthase / 23S rRNA pseudouridine746 synthase